MRQARDQGSPCLREGRRRLQQGLEGVARLPSVDEALAVVASSARVHRRRDVLTAIFFKPSWRVAGLAVVDVVGHAAAVAVLLDFLIRLKSQQIIVPRRAVAHLGLVGWRLGVAFGEAHPETARPVVRHLLEDEIPSGNLQAVLQQYCPV